MTLFKNYFNNKCLHQLRKKIRYYDRFSKVYDLVSSKWYYKKPREYAIKELELKENDTVLNIPCGTGQNFEYFQKYLNNIGTIIGIDLSQGILNKAQIKINKHNWNNTKIIKGDATKINADWIKERKIDVIKFDSILCDLGLSGFPHWEIIIDNLISLLKPGGKIVIIDWHIEKSSLRARFIKWIGKGEVERPLYQYLEKEVESFKLNDSFKRGEMFVATGIKNS
ncbi:MAG: ubiquinone/menaquinone biosynthesis C-methylase UbiE [Maribacter sp.]|jgi:ubiquinone/menaquinone biosynthesis C-methylase UbiE